MILVFSLFLKNHLNILYLLRDRWNIYLIKYSSNGTLQWEGLYADLDLWGEEGDNAGEDVCVTSDGGYLVANDVGGFGFTKISSGDK